MCDRSQFNRTRRNLMQVTNLIFTELAKQFADNVFIVDSFPLEVCKFGRARFCKVFRAEGATYGKNSSKKQTYFGFKVHAITTGSVILGDKGYVSEKLTEKLKAQGQTLLALKRNNARNPYPPTLHQEIFRRRRRIETTFSQLTEQLNAQRVLAKTFSGLSLRLLTKFLAFNLCLLLAQSSCIKSLIF